MKRKGKKRVFLYCLFIFFVFSLLGLLLINAYFRTNIILTSNTLEKLETGAYNYLVKNEDSEDIKLLKEGKIDEIYIPLEELANKGYIDDIYNVNGIIKVKYDGDYKVLYDKNNNYLTIVYHSNNDVLDTYAKTIYCDKDYLKCVKNVKWPKSTNENIDIKGFTLNSNYQNQMVAYDENLYNLLSKNEYKVKNNKINIYAITSQTFNMTVDNTLLGLSNETISCEALNWEDRCTINLPSYIDCNLEFNTKADNTGYKFFKGEKYTLTKDETIYSIPDLNGFNINANYYVKNKEKGYNLLFIIDNSYKMDDYNNLNNIKTILNKNINKLVSNNINYRLILVNDGVNEVIDTINRNEFKKAIKNINIEGNYNSNVVDSLIMDYIKDDVIVLISSNEIKDINNLSNKIYNINMDSNNSEAEYNYNASKDDIELNNLDSIIKNIISDINTNYNYTFNSNETIEVVDNLLEIDTNDKDSVTIKINDEVIVPTDYLVYRNNKTYFMIKNFIIDKKINVYNISNMEINYVK